MPKKKTAAKMPKLTRKPSVLEKKNLILLEDPYVAPQCKVGDTLRCEMYGDVEVVGFSDAPISWPLCKPEHKKPGRRPGAVGQEGMVPIVCGDLVRAIVEESHRAVAYYWGVPASLVARWREIIAGTNVAVETALMLKRADPEFQRQHPRPVRSRPAGPDA